MNTQTNWLSKAAARICLPVVALAALAGTALAQVSVYLPANDSNITYLGRVRLQYGSGTPFGQEGANIQWPGSGFKTWIYGTSKVSLLMSTYGQQYFGGSSYAPIKFKAIVDGNETVFSQPDPNQLYGSWYWNYDITGLDPYQVHTIELRRIVDPAQAATLHGITLEGPNGSSPAAYNAQSSISDRRIEFYGDSITGGGNGGPALVGNPDVNSDGDYATDSDYSFASVTARNLGADGRLISQGGAGLVRGFSNVQLENFWNLVDFDGQLHSDDLAASFQDFSSWQPRVVVIAIGHNSYYRGVYDQEWWDAYRNFALGVHNVYPNADIICMNTTMTQNYGSYWDDAINPLLNDPAFGGKIHYLPFTYQGHGGHPRSSDHQYMADVLTQKVRDITGW